MPQIQKTQRWRLATKISKRTIYSQEPSLPAHILTCILNMELLTLITPSCVSTLMPQIQKTQRWRIGCIGWLLTYLLHTEMLTEATLSSHISPQLHQWGPIDISCCF